MNNRRIEIKCEVFFEVIFDEKMSTKKIIKKIRQCETLSDLLDNDLDFNQLNDENYDIALKKSIYIKESDTTDSYFLDLE